MNNVESQDGITPKTAYCLQRLLCNEFMLEAKLHPEAEVTLHHLFQQQSCELLIKLACVSVLL